MKNNITAGTWQVFERPFLHIESGEQWIAQTSEIKVKPTEWLSPEYEAEEIRVKKEQAANAQLIADAGTTANKCGLLPSELLAQRDELLEACKDSFRILTLSPTNDNLYQRNKLFTLINKIQGEQP